VAKPSTDGSFFSYRTKVERPTRAYLFGGPGIANTATLWVGCVLILRVDDAGDPINFGTTYTVLGNPPPQDQPVGQLGPGQVWLLPLKDLLSVYAECPGGHAFVDCTITSVP
jgi:hypothetical protein